MAEAVNVRCAFTARARRVSPPFRPPGFACRWTFGVATVTTYDAAGRVARVDLPNGTYATTTVRAWSTVSASPGDNVGDSLGRSERG